MSGQSHETQAAEQATSELREGIESAKQLVQRTKFLLSRDAEPTPSG